MRVHHLLEKTSEFNVTAIVSPNSTFNYVMELPLLVTHSHGWQLQNLLEKSSEFSVNALVSPNFLYWLQTRINESLPLAREIHVSQQHFQLRDGTSSIGYTLAWMGAPPPGREIQYVS
ncbi:hypothetical protein J6590_019052 [Homalodisca vitripennis]|nr:hypothetical protein J6590_019052 [Homalodisca vitripennis]